MSNLCYSATSLAASGSILRIFGQKKMWDGPMDRPTDGWTYPLIELWVTTKNHANEFQLAFNLTLPDSPVHIWPAYMYWKVCASNVTIDIFLSMKIREIEPEAAYGVSEWQGGQRLDESHLISNIRTCSAWFLSVLVGTIHKKQRFSMNFL